MDDYKKTYQKKTGVAAAALLSSSLGCLFMGIATILAVLFPSIKAILSWWDPAGPLTGKSSVGVIAWLLSWLLLHFMWRDRSPNMFLVLAVSLTFILLSIIAMFPPFFEIFGH